MKFLYRANVAFILENTDGEVLIGERGDIAGSWQFPQGGVRNGESLEEALLREVEEEVFLLPHHYYIRQSKGPYYYRFPKVWRKGKIVGQRQHYFHALFLPEKISPKLRGPSDEFRSLRWIKTDEFQLKWLHPMKRGVYTRVFLDFFNVKIF